ncbi:conserved hypothetical protein [gamma proteobacterium NOR5-3]|nr:conserved hypothetical protein [gamma proteobacterium NOR5-3]
MIFSKLLPGALLATSLTIAVFAGAAHHEEAMSDHAERAMAIEIDAEVIAVDAETRELVLQLPTGEQMTTVVDPQVKRLAEVAPGDFLVVTYLAALAAELREPTEEEMANPWVEGADAGIAGAEDAPGGAMVSAVRAVCTIEGMNRLIGTVTILDSRGKAHVIADVKPERIEQLRIGQSVVMTFTQALAVGIEKADAM